MPNKAKMKSVVHNAYLVRDEHGDPKVMVGGEFRKRELPDNLREPLPINLAVYAQKLFNSANHSAVEELHFKSRFEAELCARMESNVKTVMETFGIVGDTREDWKRLAHELIREFIPGVRIEYLSPAERSARIRTEEKVQATYRAVADAKSTLEAKRSKMASKVTDKDAIRSVYKNWPTHLGKRPKTLAAFTTEYYRCKTEHWRASMSLAKLGAGGPA